MRPIRFAVAVTLFAALSSTANAASYVVSLSGNDANAGTLAAPFRTITKAAKIARPGDVINVRGGVYYEIASIQSKGTASAWITFQPYGSERPVIDGTGTAAGSSAVQLYEAEYVELRGFEVRNATKSGISAYGADHVRIIGNTSHHNQRNGIVVSNPAGGVAVDILIADNTVYNNNLENAAHTATSGWGQGIGAFRTDGVQIRNNRVYKNHGEGVDFILSDNGVAEGNEIFDNYGVNLYLDNAQNVTVNGNLIYTTRDATYFRHNAPATGIAVANEAYETTNLGTNLAITNNLVIGGRTGFYHANSSHGSGLSSTTVANNTFYGAEWTLVRLDTATHVNTTFANNIFYQTGGGSMVEWNFAGGVTFRNNNWYGGNPGAAAHASDIIGDPRLVNPGTNNPADYKITSASPLLLRGADYSSITRYDYFGATRAPSFDIGAHQLSGGRDVTAPAVPTGLRAVGGQTSRVVLVWTAATDDVGVTGYSILRNGAVIGSTAGTTWTDSNVVERTLYVYQVVAFDAAGNRSAPSASLPLAWSSAPADAPSDTTAPEAPVSLHATSVSATTVTLAWAAAADNVGTTKYALARNGIQIATDAATTWTDTTAEPRTTYTYQVWAADAAGNWSRPSAPFTVTTEAPAKRRSARK